MSTNYKVEPIYCTCCGAFTAYRLMYENEVNVFTKHYCQSCMLGMSYFIEFLELTHMPDTQAMFSAFHKAPIIDNMDETKHKPKRFLKEVMLWAF